MYCKVAIDVRNEISNTLFTYLVPKEYEFLGSDLIGVRVLVEFGFQKTLGYILEISEKIDFNGNIKPIFEILDITPELDEEQIELAKFMANDTASPLALSLSQMVPSFLRTKCKKVLNVNDYDSLDARVAKLLNGAKKIKFSEELLKYYSLIKTEIDRKNLEISYDTFSYGKKKRVKQYAIKEGFDESILTSKKRKDIVNYVKKNPFCSVESILDNVNCSNNLIKVLEDNNVFITKSTYIQREFDICNPSRKCDDFTILQEQCLMRYNESKKSKFLLYTNSDEFRFKFLSYLILNEVQCAKKVFIIAPTITSYTKASKMFNEYLSHLRVLKFSSRLSQGQYYDNYQSLKDRNYDVVITSKVGLFLPLSNLGLVVMLDCDNFNYISEVTPKYDSLKVLEYRARLHGCRFIASSSQPTISQYYQTNYGDYSLLKYITNTKNEVVKVDQRTYDGIFDYQMEAQIQKSLNDFKKVCVIANHSGYNTSLICRGCGEIVRCNNCHAPLVYFKDKNILKCNICDSKYEYSQICPKCKIKKVEMYGTGIERIREYLSMKYPKYNTVLVDKDITNNQKNYNDFILGLEDDKYDIYVGTELVLDLFTENYFDTIILLDCDGVLSRSDYRSNYDCFRLISKINSFKDNKFISGIKLEHYSINCALDNDYQGFYSQEIKLRNEMKNPPFYQNSRLFISGEYKDMYYYANYFKKAFSSISDGKVLGPTYDYKTRSVKLTIKYLDFNKLKKLIGDVNNKFKDKKITVNFERYPR